MIPICRPAYLCANSVFNQPAIWSGTPPIPRNTVTWCLRLDHGLANCSERFQGEIKRSGIVPSFSFVEEPQTNGVVERFNRRLKEQVIYG